MGTAMVLTAASLVLTGPGDVSGAMSKIEVTAEVEAKDVTTFTDLGWKTVKGGLKSSGVSVTFKNNYATGELDEDLWTAFGTVIAFVAKASSAAVGVSNPTYTGAVLIDKLTPISGSVGDVAEISVSWPGSGVVTRATA